MLKINDTILQLQHQWKIGENTFMHPCS